MVWVVTASVSLALPGTLLALWPSLSSPTAASDILGPSDQRADAARVTRDIDRLVVYGHSMPTGGGASDGTLAYPQVAAEAAGLQLLNRAEGGTSAENAADVMESFAGAGAGPRDAVVIHTGMNDILRRGDNAAANGRAAIERLLSGTASAQRRVLVLECQPPSWEDTPVHEDLQPAYDAWNEMLREEAAAAGGVDVLDTCAVWNPEDYVDAPKFHPNDLGHATIAEALVALLSNP